MRTKEEIQALFWVNTLNVGGIHLRKYIDISFA